MKNYKVGDVVLHFKGELFYIIDSSYFPIYKETTVTEEYVNDTDVNKNTIFTPYTTIFREEDE